MMGPGAALGSWGTRKKASQDREYLIRLQIPCKISSQAQIQLYYYKQYYIIKKNVLTFFSKLNFH